MDWLLSPATAAGAHALRTEVAAFLRRHAAEPEQTWASELTVSELVTNAVIHADSGCAVRVLLEDDVLTVTVRDRGPARSPSREPAEDTLRVHGRGLQVVETLATRWGSDRDGTGTTAWFVLELGAPSP